ncbi:MAG: DUF4012 domain-containing protein [Anaerolineales bacterium]|nr:DUF4012 domain-containing protein [Anaerolineales bacterium]MCW5855097.1 DUF4012 domain-containing protein [Anaerolineales bacterium]
MKNLVVKKPILDTERNPTELLKDVLSQHKEPQKLVDHPWVDSLVVQDYQERNPTAANNSSYALLQALADLFKDMLPSTPPRRGKRLDTAWGQFGVLGAMYFAEIEFGLPAANSLRDAWGKIDNVISLYVRQKFGDGLSQAEEEKYYLLSDEKEITPTSTLSDWHARGLERFAKMLYAKERRLNSKHAKQAKTGKISRSWSPSTYIKWTMLGMLLALLAYLGWVGGTSYVLARELYGQARDLKAMLSSGLDLQRASELTQTGVTVREFRQTASALSERAAPLIWLADRLTWIPFIGEELSLVSPILSMTELSSMSADQFYQGISPMLGVFDEESAPTSLDALTGMLHAAAPHFRVAVYAAGQAGEIREGLDLDAVHSTLRDLILEEFDPAFYILHDSAQVMASLIPLLGMEGQPANYLLLLQNEDELRPTGGYITAVGGLVLQDGKILSFNLENSYEVDDYDYLYPAAPWQLEEYMAAPILVLRDANWRPDFPVVAQQVEILYAYSRAHTVDGVIAINQHALSLLVGALGSVRVDGQLITSDNVLTYMQAERGAVPDPGERTLENQQWFQEHRKDFMQPMAEAILARLRSGSNVSWEEIISVLNQALDEKHILLQFDDASVDSFLAQYGWDGQLRYSEGDYLMLVDTNVGFTKSNPIVDSEVVYRANLMDLKQPTGALGITYLNRSEVVRDCDPRPGVPGLVLGDYEIMIHDCYWTYLRVYRPDGTRLTDYQAQSVPGEWVLSGNAVPDRIDYLDELEGFAEFGTLVVVPTQQSQTIAMAFSLPDGMIQQTETGYVYRLTLQKQPGVKQVDLNLGILLPVGAQVVSSSHSELSQQGNEVSGQLKLSRDTVIELTFLLP